MYCKNIYKGDINISNINFMITKHPERVCIEVIVAVFHHRELYIYIYELTGAGASSKLAKVTRNLLVSPTHFPLYRKISWCRESLRLGVVLLVGKQTTFVYHSWKTICCLVLNKSMLINVRIGSE